MDSEGLLPVSPGVQVKYDEFYIWRVSCLFSILSKNCVAKEVS